MEITLGDKIKINGEEVPEYLLKALYEWYLNNRIVKQIIQGKITYPWDK